MQNERPGIYSAYTITSRYTAPRSKKAAGLVCKMDAALCGQLHRLENFPAAATLLPANHPVLHYCRLLFACGVSAVILSGVTASYATATALLEVEPNIGVLLSDAQAEVDCAAVLESVDAASEQHRERTALFGFAQPETAKARALALNSHRAVVICPTASFENYTGPLIGACHLAGRILALGQPGYNYNNLDLPLIQISETTAESTIQNCLAAGVTMLEQVGDSTQCIRVLTTRTKTGGMEDRSYRSLNTTLIIDDVMQSVRNTLAQRLAGIRTAKTGLESLASQVLLVLTQKQREGLIESCQVPRCYADAEDPSVCVVEIAFTVAHVISQIHLTAQIQL